MPLDDTHSPVGAGYPVTGIFSGGFNETQAAVIKERGVAEILTVATQRGGIRFSFRVDDLDGALPYERPCPAFACRRAGAA